MKDKLHLHQSLAVLDSRKVAQAEKQATKMGLPVSELMERAGTAVFQQIMSNYKPRKTLVLVGVGNNGGDALVVARKLGEQGWDVHILDCKDEIINLDGIELIVDGIFGLGLDRPIEGRFKDIIEAVNNAGKPVVAIDMPSGINADSGEIMGCAIKADLTVTFNFKKTGHLLLPGKANCGKVIVANIGLPMDNIDQHQVFINHKNLWSHLYPLPDAFSNKYSRGHLGIVAGGEMTGAPRLAAFAARKVGTGLVTLICHADIYPIYATTSPGILIETYTKHNEFMDIINSPKIDGLLVGSGLEPDMFTHDTVLAVLRTLKPAVIDAGAITAFQNQPGLLIKRLHENCILTPHEGEFKRIFKYTGAKIADTNQAVRDCGASVLYKGADTVISGINDITLLQDMFCPHLATGGTGDIQSGMIAGLIVQGVSPAIAGAMATWILNRAGAILGYGLIAEEIPSVIPRIIKEDIRPIA